MDEDRYGQGTLPSVYGLVSEYVAVFSRAQNILALRGKIGMMNVVTGMQRIYLLVRGENICR